MKMKNIKESLKLSDDIELKSIEFIQEQKGVIEENCLNFKFKDGKESIIPIAELIQLYNYGKRGNINEN